MDLFNSRFPYLFYTFFLILISSSSFASSNLRDWTFNSSGQSILHIDATTQYNDSLYSRSITLDNSISNHKAYILSIVKNRLFRVNDGFTISSVSALHSKLLESNWIIDNERRIIYKDVYPDRECTYFNSNHELVDFTATGIGKFACPYDAVQALSKYNASQYTPARSYTWNGWQSEAINHSNNAVTARYMFEENSTTYYEQLTVSRFSVHDKEVLPKRIFMTESQLFDFILSCNCFNLIDAYKAFNNYEKINNQGYLYLTNRLMPSEPTVTDIVLPDDGNTGGGNTGGGNTGGNTGGDGSQSSFCTTFSTVCDFIDWFKKDPDSSTNDPLDIQNSDYGHYYTEYFPWTPQCPRPVVIDADIDLIFHVEHFYYEYDYSFLCEFLYKISNYIIFAAYIGCAFIIGGVRNG